MHRFMNSYVTQLTFFYCFQQKHLACKLIFPSPIITIKLSKNKLRKDFNKSLEAILPVTGKFKN